MKVYLPTLFNLNINNINTNNKKLNNHLNKIKKYFTKSNQLNTIVSNHGIFQLHKNKLMRIEIVDIPCTEHKIEDLDLELVSIIDYSKTKFDEECTQLPLEHCVEQFILYEYSLRPGGQVHLVVEKYNINNIKDVYFLANDDINLQILNEDIISFLEALKLY